MILCQSSVSQVCSKHSRYFKQSSSLARWNISSQSMISCTRAKRSTAGKIFLRSTSDIGSILFIQYDTILNISYSIALISPNVASYITLTPKSSVTMMHSDGLCSSILSTLPRRFYAWAFFGSASFVCSYSDEISCLSTGFPKVIWNFGKIGHVDICLLVNTLLYLNLLMSTISSITTLSISPTFEFDGYCIALDELPANQLSLPPKSFPAFSSVISSFFTVLQFSFGFITLQSPRTLSRLPNSLNSSVSLF